MSSVESDQAMAAEPAEVAFMRRPVRPVNGAIVDDLDALPTLPLPAQCSYMVRGKRQCKRFAETSARTVCPEHTPEALAQSRQTAITLAAAALAEETSGGGADEAAGGGGDEDAAEGGGAALKSTRAKSKSGGTRKHRVSSSQRRMRNPLNVAVISAEECDAILDRFNDTTLPFVVDLGSALGDFLLGLESRWRGGPGVDLLRDVASPGVAATHTAPSTTAEDPEDSNSRQSGGSPALAREGSVASASSAAPSNYLGLELRGWCVDHAIKHVPAEAAGRLWFAALSVHNSLKVLIDRLHERGERGAVPVLRGVTIQFPDPWAKAKTVRRRILQPDLAELIVRNLEVTHGFLYASTDCAVMARDMELVMEPHCAAGVMRRAVVYGDVGVDGGDPQASSWLPSNPFGVPSEREARVCSVFGRAPFRALYWKVAECA